MTQSVWYARVCTGPIGRSNRSPQLPSGQNGIKVISCLKVRSAQSSSWVYEIPYPVHWGGNYTKDSFRVAAMEAKSAWWCNIEALRNSASSLGNLWYAYQGNKKSTTQWYVEWCLAIMWAHLRPSNQLASTQQKGSRTWQSSSMVRTSVNSPEKHGKTGGRWSGSAVHYPYLLFYTPPPKVWNTL